MNTVPNTCLHKEGLVWSGNLLKILPTVSLGQGTGTSLLQDASGFLDY